MTYKARTGQAFAAFALTPSVLYHAHMPSFTFSVVQIHSHSGPLCSSLHRVFSHWILPRLAPFLQVLAWFCHIAQSQWALFISLKLCKPPVHDVPLYSASQRLFSVLKRYLVLSLSKHPVLYLLYLTTICNHIRFVYLFCNAGLPHPTTVCESRKFIFLIITTLIYSVFGTEPGIWQHLIDICSMNECINSSTCKIHRFKSRTAEKWTEAY